MKRVLLGILVLLVGMIAGLVVGLLLSTEQRLSLSRRLAACIGGMIEQMPEG